MAQQPSAPPATNYGYDQEAPPQYEAIQKNAGEYTHNKAGWVYDMTIIHLPPFTLSHSTAIELEFPELKFTNFKLKMLPPLKIKIKWLIMC